MKRFIEGEDRRQATLLSDGLEDYVTADNPVRVIDVFIDELDLEAFGLAGAPSLSRNTAPRIGNRVFTRPRSTAAFQED
jgi:transposase